MQAGPSAETTPKALASQHFKPLTGINQVSLRQHWTRLAVFNFAWLKDHKRAPSAVA